MYNIKVYDRAGTNIYKVLPQNFIEGNYNFKETVDFGQQEFNFSYYGDRFVENSLEGTVDLFKKRNIVEVYQDGTLIYTGWILSITEKQDKKGFRFVVKISGLTSLLSKVQYTGSSAVSNPTTAILNCISDVNTKLGLNIDITKVQTYDNPYNWSIKNAEHCLDVLNQAMEKTKDRYFFINEKREAIFQPYTDGASETFIFGKDVSSISNEEDLTSLVNKIYIDWIYRTQKTITVGTETIVVEEVDGGSVVVEDTASIAENGLLEKSLYLDQEVTSDSAATSYGEDYLSKHIIDEYNIIKLEKPKQWAGLHPGDNITVRNTEIIIKNDIIKKISYDKTGAYIETKDYESLEQFLTTNSA